MPTLKSSAIVLLVSASLVARPASATPLAWPRDSRSAVQQKVVRRAKARDADQRYLRALADHLEFQRALAHSIMSAPGSHASHGSAMDPAAWDGTFDTQQREAVALLQHDYGELLTPRSSIPAAPVQAPQGEDAERAAARVLRSRLREAIALSKRALPRLRRASSRSLARQVISTHGKLIEELSAMTGH